METLMINIKSEEDKRLFLSLAKRLRLKTTFLNREAFEDIGLLRAMKEGETGEYIDRDSMMNALKE